jgi:hypothetical protein
MKFITFALLLMVGLVGCGSNPNPVINKQTTALQVLQRLNEFQDVVLDLYNSKSITPEHAVLYSKFVVSTTKTVTTLPDGWQTTVRSGWTELQKLVPMNQMEPKVQIAAKLLDAAIAVL